MRASDLLDERGVAAIEAAVHAAERATSGEIVPVIVERSDAYAELRFGAAALIAFASGALALLLAPELAYWLVPLQLGVFVACAWLLGRRDAPAPAAPRRRRRARASRARQRSPSTRWAWSRRASAPES